MVRLYDVGRLRAEEEDQEDDGEEEDGGPDDDDDSDGSDDDMGGGDDDGDDCKYTFNMYILDFKFSLLAQQPRMVKFS